MCGRVRMDEDYTEIVKLLKIPKQMSLNLRPRWNAPPTSDLPIARLDDDGQRILEISRWWLRPSIWANDPKASTYAMFNARAEGIANKPAFRNAWKQGRRCLVPVNNFYEWKTLGPKEKQPYAIALADRSIMVIAGLYENWTTPEGEAVKSFTIITTEANNQMATLHTRMPVILHEADWPAWLGEQPANDDTLHALLKPYGGELAIWRVDKRVGNPKNDDPGVAEAIAIGGRQ